MRFRADCLWSGRLSVKNFFDKRFLKPFWNHFKNGFLLGMLNNNNWKKTIKQLIDQNRRLTCKFSTQNVLQNSI